jgi:hypothetical protein
MAPMRSRNPCQPVNVGKLMTDAAAMIALQAFLERMAINLNRSRDSDSFFDALEAVGMVALCGVNNAIVYGILKPLETTVFRNIVPGEIAQQFCKVEVCPLTIEMSLQFRIIIQIV